jgi:hypothetical protein
VHNNKELNLLVTGEGLEYNERFLRRAGKQFKSGGIGTEFQEELEILGLIYTWQN